MKQQGRIYTVEGIITPIHWDGHDEVTQLSIYTQDGEDVLLDCGKFFNSLKKLLKKNVRLQGYLVEAEDGEHVLKVSKILPELSHPKIYNETVPDKVFAEELRILSPTEDHHSSVG